MTITNDYIINDDLLTEDIRKWIQLQNNLTRFNKIRTKFIVTIDHVDEAAAHFFQSELSRRLGIEVNGVHIDPAKLMEELQTDLPLLTMTPRLQITNLSTNFTDVFPALYDGFPIPIHTMGYKKMGFILLWNKGGGTPSAHDIRVVKSDSSGALLPDAVNPDVLISANNIPSGRSFTFDFDVPTSFLKFRGHVKIQAKSGNGTDSPFLDALFIYLIRGDIL